MSETGGIFLLSPPKLYSTSQPESSKIKAFEEKINSTSNRNVIIMEEQLTCMEIELAIDKLKVGKAPRMNGYHTELYKKFKSQLSEHLQELLKKCLKLKRLPLSWSKERHVNSERGLI